MQSEKRSSIGLLKREGQSKQDQNKYVLFITKVPKMSDSTSVLEVRRSRFWDVLIVENWSCCTQVDRRPAEARSGRRAGGLRLRYHLLLRHRRLHHPVRSQHALSGSHVLYTKGFVTDRLAVLTNSGNAQKLCLQVVEMLNDLYTCFDSTIGHFDVYKVQIRHYVSAWRAKFSTHRSTPN